MSNVFSLGGMLDRVLPVDAKSDAALQSRLRMFAFISLSSSVAGLAGLAVAVPSIGMSLGFWVGAVASLALLLAPFTLRSTSSAGTVMFGGYLLLLCLALSFCSLLGGLRAPTAPLLLPLPVLAYVLLTGRDRQIGLAVFLTSMLALIWLDWRNTVTTAGLSPQVEHALFIGSVAAGAIIVLFALWKLESLHIYAKDRIRNEALNDRVAAENLELAKSAAERDSLTKSRLLASVSMDMRAPLTAIIGFSQIIGHEMMGPIGNNQYRSYAEDIESSGYKVLETIERVVDLARLQAGEFRLREESFDLIALLRELSAEMRPMVENARMRFSLDLPEGQFFVYADRRGIRQIVLNLLTNALRYTEIEGQAGIALRLGESGEAKLSIWDNGPGIAPERMLQIFDPCAVQDGLNFNARDEEWADCVHGLGLPVSRLLAERHGGALAVESTPGQGTTVVVTIPTERVSVAVHELSAHSSARGGSKIYPLATAGARDSR